MKKRMPSEMEQTRERKRAPRRVFARRRDASEKGGSEAARRVPLHALLSRAYGAFVIEFDNEFERQMPHRTARYGVARGEGEDLRGEDLPDEEVPYLVSMVIWERFLRHIDDDEGVAAGELLRRVRTNRKQLKNWLTRTGKWWGYVEIKRGRDPGADDAGGGAGGSTRVRLTRAGRMAKKVWVPLAGRIEKRWEERFGMQQIDALRRSLAEIDAQLDARLPGTLPILGWGMFCRKARRKDAAGAGGVEKAERNGAAEVSVQGRSMRRGVQRAGVQGAGMQGGMEGASLAILLSRLLLAYAVEFERKSEVSLAICANVLRLVGIEGSRVRDLPRAAGISKEAVAMAISFLTLRGYAVVKKESSEQRMKREDVEAVRRAGSKMLMLTSKGRRALGAYGKLTSKIEERWRARFGERAVGELREALEQLADSAADGQGGMRGSSLLAGIEPAANGWRAKEPAREAWPWFPIVLHRGGFPDGS